MTTRLALAVGLVVAAILVARWLQRRRPAPPTRGVYPVPAQLDRDDFPRPDAPLLVVLFSSRSCDSCKPMAELIAALESEAVATCDAEFTQDKELHRRYGIEGVPTTVVVDADGVVRSGFVGAVGEEELQRALAEAGP